MIESLQNAKIKRLTRLRDGSARRKANRFLIDGEREITAALQRSIEIEAIFLDEPTQHRCQSQLAACQHLIQRVSTKVMDRISYGQRQHCPVAIAVTPHWTIDDLALVPESLLMVLDRTEKPGNLGACLRTAAACGVDAVVMTNPVSEVFNPNAIHASRGAIFTLPIAVASVRELLAGCEQLGIPLFAARVDAQADLWQQDLRGGAAFVFGSEAHGLGDDWPNTSVRPFRIPMHGSTDSLNLSISAAVTLYEAFRQRTQAAAR
jgi:TrmH family RNA methyltransferase